MKLTRQEAARLVTDVINVAQETITGEMPAVRLSILMFIALNPGTNQSEIGERMKLSQSTISRNLLELGPVTVSRKKGPNLVSKTPDPAYMKRYLLDLTPEGRDLVDRIAAQINRRLSAKEH